MCLSAGNTARLKWFGGIGEYRIDWGLGYRVYLAPDGERLILLLGGGTKRDRQAGIEREKGLYAEDMARKTRVPRSQTGRKLPQPSMALTHDFRQTIAERVEHDSEFAKALFDEAVALFLNGEPGTTRLSLRDLVNATVGFETLARLTDRPSKCLHRMLSSNGNPSTGNLATIFGALRDRLRVDIEVHAVDAA